MLEIAICSTEMLTISRLENMLEDLMVQMKIKLSIDVFYESKKLISCIKNGQRYDTIYLDIDEKHLQLVDITNHIKVSQRVLIIYLMHYEKINKDIFEMLPFRMLTKPINYQKFLECFIDIKNMLLNESQYFHYQYNRISYRVSIDNIIYMQSNKRVVYIVTKEEGARKCYEKLDIIEQRLLKHHIHFYRIHQSFLVNPQYLTAYAYNMVELVEGTMLSISEKRRKHINELCRQFVQNDIKV